MRIIQYLKRFYWNIVATPEKYARHLGVSIGNNCSINTRHWPSEAYLITIGDNVQVTGGVWFHTHGGANAVRRQHPDFDVFGKIAVEDWAYIGTGAQIMPGVTIGEGALVAAGSIVTKSIPPYTVVGGNPARVICTIEEYYERNKKYDIGTKNRSVSDKKKILLSLRDEMFIKK